MSDNVIPNSLEAEYMDIVNRGAWTLVYQRIGQKAAEYDFTCNEAKKPQNKALNRYRDVNPYDHSRFVLSRVENGYINANLVKMDRVNRQYILTQGPLVFTVGHFWLMAWEANSRAIIMLNKIIEKNEIKCHWYWPQGQGPQNKMTLTDVNLTIELVSEEDNNYYTTRYFKIYDMLSEEVRDVIQFHYTTWPDFEVPTSPNAFLNFLERVRDSGALEPDVGPAVVHCSAGIGRSGTFCLVDSCLLLIEREGVDAVNIQEILLDMRRHRMGLIQTSDQLRFSYQAIIEGAKRLDPDYVRPKLDESIYSAVAEEEEAPPPPPPRGESLARPPARPLPAIPSSASLGNLDMASTSSPQEVDSSDEAPPTPPRRAPPAPPSPPDADLPETDAVSGEARRRRHRDRALSDRLSSIKKRVKETERWHAFKRSLYKPLTITVGFLLAGIVIYSYIRH